MKETHTVPAVGVSEVSYTVSRLQPPLYEINL